MTIAILAATVRIFVPTGMASTFWSFFVDSVLSEPTTPMGHALKLGVLIKFFGPIACVLMAGALANFERPVFVVFVVAFMVYASVVLSAIESMWELTQEVPSSSFYILWVAVPINLFVVGLVLLGVQSLWRLKSSDCDTLRDGFGLNPIRSALGRLFGMPAFIRYLGARRLIIVPLYILSSLFLALSLYGFLFAAGRAKELRQINRAECINDLDRFFDHDSALEGYLCFEQAMLRDALLFPVYVMVGFGVMFGLHLLFRRLARSLSITSMRNLMASDKRPPVLFLRPFGNDQVALQKPDRFSLFRAVRIGDEPRFLEHQVLEEMTELGPVVAIGDPSKVKVPYGAAREYLSDEVWQQRVESLIDTSRLIVIVLNDTPGVWWEVQTVIARGAINRTLFIFPRSREVSRSKLWENLGNALEAKGIALPEMTSSVYSVLGLFRETDSWTTVHSNSITSTETLALLRLFGTSQVGKHEHSTLSPRRYPFTVGLITLALFAFFVDDVLRITLAGPEVVAQHPEGWEVTTIVGPEMNNKLGEDLYFESSVPLGPIGHHLVAARRVDNAPALVWVSPENGVDRTAALPVQGLAQLRRQGGKTLSPVAVAVDGSGNILTAVSTSEAEQITLNLHTVSEDGNPVAQVEAAAIPNLIRVLAGEFLEDGTVYVSGQVKLAERGRGPFFGKLRPTGVWEWYYNDFGGIGWGNHLAVASDGATALALQVEKEFRVIAFDPKGEVSFIAGSPFSEQFGAASSIVSSGAAHWTVAGYVKSTQNIDQPHTPIVASLTHDGAYDWATTLNELQDYYVHGLAYFAGTTYVAASTSGLNDAKSAVAVINESGELTEVLRFESGGTREIRTIGIAQDGALWLYGLAADAPRNAAPMERFLIKATPWIVRIVAPKSGENAPRN